MRIPNGFLLYAVGRARDVPGDVLTSETIHVLATKGRPTLLLSLDGRQTEAFPAPLRRYLRQGEEMGLPGRPPIATRR
jgi:hypothetical protein